MLHKIVKEIYRHAPRKARLKRKFLEKNGYRPNLKKPGTFNEKILIRKLAPRNPLFSVCADKVAVREYVEEHAGSKYLIPLLYTGSDITAETILKVSQEHGAVVLKANHNSGPVFFSDDKVTDAKARMLADALRKQLLVDYGEKSQEPWYSQIDRRILIEKKLGQPDEDIPDYKFHIFNNKDKQTVVIQMDFDRHTNHNRSFFDEDFNWLPFVQGYPCLKTHVKAPSGLEEMLNIAKKLASPFSYARVDLYNVNDEIFFGELTFAHESGLASFSPSRYDAWMGSLWKGDPTS